MIKLGWLDNLAEGQVRVCQPDDNPEILLVRRDATVYAYLNSCPHTGAPLNWLPNQFLSHDGRWLQCANHDALFRVEDGYCLAGPCQGQSLKSFQVYVDTATGEYQLRRKEK